MKTYETNPFNPQFGKRPKNFVGRDSVLRDFHEGISNHDSPNRTTILTGIRGTGKTSILSDIRQSLDSKKFLVIDATVNDGMLLMILDEFSRQGKAWLGNKYSKIQSVSIGGLGFTFGISKSDSKETHGFRYFVSEMLETLKKKKISTLFLLDEAHNDTPEMREFAITYQHLIREEMDVALLMAGLPHAVQDILNDKVLTFLRRAHRVYLANIDIDTVALAFESAFKAGGRSFADGALHRAAAATEGYPYLMQLVGYYLWESGSTLIGEKDIEDALVRSKAELYQNIHELIYSELSAKDKAFVMAMSEDEMESEFGAIAARMGVSSGYASRYRRRLIDAGVIHRSAYGTLSFTPPYMRDFLLRQMQNGHR